MKRRAKTPVFSVGQLEGFPPVRDVQTPAQPAGGVEVLAEQYRALLESRSAMFSDSISEPPPSRHEHDTVGIRRNSFDELHGEAPEAAPPGCSPTSDDGTFVGFDEETVYFKPVSFSPEPLSPGQTLDFPVLSPASVPDNLSLQICLDLLTRELSSATLDRRPQRGAAAASEVSALQILVMIEAYERLRDQLLDSRLGHDELRPIEMMFDMWLRALYTIHDALTGSARASESEYEGLETAALD